MICDIPYLIKKSDCLEYSPVCVVRDICREPDTAARGLSSLHQHSFIELSYIIDGCGSLRIWNEAYPIRQGDLYVMNAAVPHGYFSHEEEPPPLVGSLFFDPHDLFDSKINEIGGQNYLFGLFAHNNFAVHLSLKSKQLDSVIHTVDSIEEELACLASGWQDAVRARLTLLLLTVRRLADASRTPHPYRGNENEPLAAAALQLIGERFGDPDFSLSTAAGLLYKSQSALSRSFHAVTGEHFSDYLRTVRLHHAAHLAINTSLSNEEIAPLCGYRDIPSFYRQFRRSIGMTPGAYRKQHKISNTNIQEALTMNQSIYTE
ncbi:MAG: helix-turn-helix domain-containing protein, partial [Clostridia bacterium]|nr:helix-turn-helix domain-containing protein [Clostridia bacterium]